MPATYTVQNPWQKVRSEVSAADTPMTDAEKHWSARDTTMGVTIPTGANGIIVGLLGDDEDSDATITVYVYAERGPAEWVIGATFTIGAQEVVEDITDNALPPSSLKLADTIAVVDQGWAEKLLTLEDYEGDDGLARIKFDGCGAKFLKVEVSALDTGLKVTPIFRYW